MSDFPLHDPIQDSEFYLVVSPWSPPICDNSTSFLVFHELDSVDGASSSASGSAFIESQKLKYRYYGFGRGAVGIVIDGYFSDIIFFGTY